MAFNADVQKLEPGNLIRLFEVDATRLGGNLWRFHGHAQEGEIIWQGNVYEPIQITAKGFDIRGDGRPASPTLQLANELAGIRGAISAICLQLRDLCGARVRVIETWRHYLMPRTSLMATPMQPTRLEWASGSLSRRPRKPGIKSHSRSVAPSTWRVRCCRPSRSPSFVDGRAEVSTVERLVVIPAQPFSRRKTSLPTTQLSTGVVAAGAVASCVAIPTASAVPWGQV